MQHRDFPGGHPSQYYSGPKALNFRVLMGSGVVALVWPHHAKCVMKKKFIHAGVGAWRVHCATRELERDAPVRVTRELGSRPQEFPSVCSPSVLCVTRELERDVPVRVTRELGLRPKNFPSVCSPSVLWVTLDLASLKVTNRWDGEAESQWIVAARLLYHLQYLVPYLSRLQRIHLPDHLKLNAKCPSRYVPPARGSSRHMLLGAHARPY